MARFFALLALPLLASACATLTADSEQPITVNTTPAGAECALRNDAGSWEIAKTPGTVAVKRDFSPLHITCGHEGQPALTATLEAKTRGRAYANILMGGVPALVDAHTGDGYEYAPAEVTLPQTKE